MTLDLATDLHVRRLGRHPDDAPTLLFLHGLTDSGSGWPGAERHWADAYALVTADQRGHGRSPRFTPDQLEAHPGDVMVADAVTLLEQLPCPAVIGHSLGGAVALSAAGQRPHLVRALVLEDPAPLGPGEVHPNPERGAEFLEGVSKSLAASTDTELVAVRRAAHPDWAEDELLASGVAEQQMDVDYLTRADYKPTVGFSELFASVDVPTLVVTGGRVDEVVVTETMEQAILELRNDQVSVVRIPDAGHCIRREQPEAFYSVVDEFLRAHLSR